ncbi:type ISP restriction/modification enzyme [Mesorhizobium sp.]|uniref:type ISP restriction/modification enzyme n=1 Tax=Mesorhizobium sp. TaxID=1871066 RepID=UPI000FE6BD3F|nr:type ISP restriction/modification enzyme [Mesorhizobium sp.]RWQ46942.1 MAG: hypothetical protein EOS84_29580 [Mesorhizobium sp.]
MSEITATQLARVTSFPKLVELLRDKLDWPIGNDYGFDDIVYEYDADDLGLKEDEVAKIREIHQLRPLVTGQPWGIFFISFEEKGISVTVLRRMLRALVVKKRSSAQTTDRQSWKLHDLIFITNFGKSGDREIAIAHFADGAETGDLPILNVLGWNGKDTKLHNAYAAELLQNRLHWPDDTRNLKVWRENWSAAFELRHGQVIKTSKDLASRLAALATNIRARANQLLEAESDKGPMRTMMEAFRKNLIQDLDADGFADMFAQTIAYGLLAAHISRPSGGLVADNLVDMVPKTNPFLRELFGTFLSLGGRDKRSDIDFDELGVRDVVNLLTDEHTDMAAVLRDFGDRNPEDDPVIHFYELFLKEYDPQKRVQRGVFYTPRPVVNFIVRGVDEVLRTEFGLPLGLADTTTWGEVASKNRDVKVPKHVAAESPFVQILDPATGTGTFLVEVIDLVHARMVEYWKQQGLLGAEIQQAWNAYVPKHLLPRLTGFELMMAPYAIAHMKIGLKLVETGYRFGSDERARIFLTNALEPARDLDMQFVFMAEALAHEAKAANDAKANAAFTVVVGNPPYSRVSRNKNAFARQLVQPFKDAVPDEKNQQPLEDDYLKFLAIAFYLAEKQGSFLISMITNHNFNEGVLFRGARRYFLNRSSSVRIISLHGEIHSQNRPIEISSDQNVFDISTGVSISCFGQFAGASGKLTRNDLWGDRDAKLEALSTLTLRACLRPMNPVAPFYFFKQTSMGRSREFENWKTLPSIYRENSSGVMTVRDQIAIDFTEDELVSKISQFCDEDLSDDEVSALYGLKTYRTWTVASARRKVRNDPLRNQHVKNILYRPFDKRVIFYSADLVTYPNTRVMDHLGSDNIALVSSRLNKGEEHAHEMVSSCMVEIISLSSKSSNNAYVFPLWLQSSSGERYRRPNIDKRFALDFGQVVGLTYDDGIQREPGKSMPADHRGPALSSPGEGRGDLITTFGPRDLFDWIYAILHSPGYRARYSEFLKSDFPHVATPKDRGIFAALVPLGSALVSLHLMKPDEMAVLREPEIRFAGRGEARIGHGYPRFERGKVLISDSRWFEDVPPETWAFNVGGYQVCEKWLKDRAARGGKRPSPGRLLTDGDVLHYRRVVTALTETRRIMAEIDNVINAHGGWPDAFYAPPPPPPTIEEIIQADEGQDLEYKSTFQFDIEEGGKSKLVRKAALKTIVGFLNSGGGSLVIGVTDDKNIVGVEPDFSTMAPERRSREWFQQTLVNLINEYVGTEFAPSYEIRFASSEGKLVCIVDVKGRAPKPAYLKDGDSSEFYVRTSNLTKQLKEEEIANYVSTHWQ